MWKNLFIYKKDYYNTGIILYESGRWSINSFLSPIKQEEAINYWQTVLAPEVILFIAKINNKIVGSVQLYLIIKPNGIMIHPNF